LDWKDGTIEDCGFTPFRRFTDERGWLAEIFRADELDESQFPAMGYVSVTVPGMSRGPHEHRYQSDLFAFYSGRFVIYLWDERSESVSFGKRMRIEAGVDNPMIVSIPPGVVHAYRNIGSQDAYVFNFPNRLYAGQDRAESVDEIRHEELIGSRYLMD
jgi:dTDP-4-dehydrorhamnose 3,5-epimerase